MNSEFLNLHALNLLSKDIGASVRGHWEKSGVFVFTSAGSVYAENESGEVDETSEVARSERSGKLLDGEETVIEAGGSVLRLGGLYTETRSVGDFINLLSILISFYILQRCSQLLVWRGG